MGGGYGPEQFVSEARVVIAENLSPAATLARLTGGFARLLRNPTFLRRKLDEIGSRSDEVCLHAEPGEGFVVLARGVGQRPAVQGKSHAVVPHDHGPLWALYGVYQGSSTLQRWEPDPRAATGTFPGLRLVGERLAKAGDYDAIEPHTMHLPAHAPGAGTIILVAYAKPLESVIRRGYVAAARTVVEFQGTFPPLALSA